MPIFPRTKGVVAVNFEFIEVLLSYYSQRFLTQQVFSDGTARSSEIHVLI